MSTSILLLVSKSFSMSEKNIQTDVLVIGSGIGGLLTALRCSEKTKVILATKSTLSQTATRLAQGGIAAVQDFTTDSFAEHHADTLRAGHAINKPKIVKQVVEMGPEILTLLKTIGVEFDESLHLEGGHTHHRIAHVKDMTGKIIEETLIRAVKKSKNISVHEHMLAIDLLYKNNICQGATFFRKNKVVAIEARETVLATGGVGQVYLHTTNPVVATGDGIAMAHRARVKTEGLEFIQFHPTALDESKSPQLLLSEALRGAGAHIVNAKGERFMKRYDERGDLSPRDIVTKAIFEERKKGRVYLQFEENKKSIHKEFPTISAGIKQKMNLDLAKDMIPITPVAHYLCGGIKTNANGETSMKHLYAVGECASTGLHGANRLASNSLLEAAVFATKTAESVLKNYTKNTIRIPDKTTRLTPATQTYKLKTLRKKIQTIMWEKVGILRTTDALKSAVRDLNLIRPLLPPPHIINEEISTTRNLLEVSLLITKAALARKKSIGCHWRT